MEMLAAGWNLARFFSAILLPAVIPEPVTKHKNDQQPQSQVNPVLSAVNDLKSVSSSFPGIRNGPGSELSSQDGYGGGNQGPEKVKKEEARPRHAMVTSICVNPNPQPGKEAREEDGLRPVL